MVELDLVSVIYEGVLLFNGFGFFVQVIYSGNLVFWIFFEFYGVWDWWLCKQDLSDKIDSIDVLVCILVVYKVASNGLLKEIIEDGNEYIYYWKYCYFIFVYLIVIVVINYVEYFDFVLVENGELIEVFNYVFLENLVDV